MKKLSFALTAATALFMASCTVEQDDIAPVSQQAQQESNAIAFGTKVGKTGTTRAGAAGGITQDNGKLKEADFGFGVFAYSTGTTSYGDYRTLNATGTAQYPNFMYNEKLKWNETTDKWEYSPIKYWPNEVQNGDVDDQNGNTSNDPATTGYENGGNVSFFAYAPYVDLGTLTSATDIDGQPTNETTDGIVAFSGNKYNGNNGVGVEKFSDPYLKFVLPENKIIDLLWATAGTNGANVVGGANVGSFKGDNNDVNDGSTIGGADCYEDNILRDFTMNTDLTKQTVNGKVEFAFKHALAKIGGSYTGSGDGDDEDGTTPTNGLMVILDIDKDGQESGGTLEPYSATMSQSEYATETTEEWTARQARNKYNTKVTINEIVLDAEKELQSGVNLEDLNFDYESSTYTTTLKNTGYLNLATGQWSDQTTTGTSTHVHQTISQKEVPANPALDNAKDAILSEEIAEPMGFTASTRTNLNKAGFESLPIGVTTVAKNVYESDAQPFVFIPGTKPIITVTIDYNVRTYDAKLANTYTEVRQRITKRLYITKAVELNKQYNILIHLGLTGVKFTAIVSDWDVTNVTGTTTVDPETGSPITIITEDVDHVYLPINVGEPSAVAATFTHTTDADATSLIANDGSTTIGGNTMDWNVSSLGANGVLKLSSVTADTKGVELTHVLLSSDVDWITFSGAGTDNQTVNVAVNKTPNARQGKVTVTYDGKSQDYWINQRAATIETVSLSIVDLPVASP